MKTMIYLLLISSCMKKGGAAPCCHRQHNLKSEGLHDPWILYQGPRDNSGSLSRNNNNNKKGQIESEADTSADVWSFYPKETLANLIEFWVCFAVVDQPPMRLAKTGTKSGRILAAAWKGPRVNESNLCDDAPRDLSRSSCLRHHFLNMGPMKRHDSPMHMLRKEDTSLCPYVQSGYSIPPSIPLDMLTLFVFLIFYRQ